MSEPITLTKRERAVFSHMARTLGNGKAGDDIIVSNALLHFLDADYQVRSAQSVPPPRVPGASARDELAGVESGPGGPIGDLLPGEPAIEDHVAFLLALADTNVTLSGIVPRLRLAAAEITRLREQVKTERRAGIEAAAQECRHYYADPMRNRWYFVQNATAIDIQKTIRALADKPAPDALLAGIEHVREHLRTDGNAVRLIAWLDAEIAARKGG